MLGCAPAHELFGLLHVDKKPGIAEPRHFSDYEVTIERDRVPAGVTLVEVR
jgi:CRISPR-associated protein Csd2